MIRCECGEYFSDTCSHSEHKQFHDHPEEHKTVCSICSKEFKVYPVTGDEVKVAKFHGRMIVWVVCHECMVVMNGNPSHWEIMDFEEGNMTEVELINFFQKMINSGLCWQLQGFYGRTAANLMENGYCFDPRQLTWE